MNTTSFTLLDRLRQPENREAWTRFVSLYTPLLYRWARQRGLQEADAADLVQEVLAVLAQKLPTFKYDPEKTFRGWLWTICLNKWRDFQRRKALTPGQSSFDGSSVQVVPDPLERLTEEEYRQYLVERALKIMQTDFQATTWKACWKHVVEGRKAADVANELGITIGAVYVATSRVLSRLRECLQGLLD